MASLQQITVPDRVALDSAIANYVAQGYAVQHQAPDRAVLHKEKKFEVLWAVIGFVLCLFPLLVYLVVYAAQSSKTVELRIGSAAQPAGAVVATTGAAGQAVGQVGQLSPDGRWRWDGAAWQPVIDDDDIQITLNPPR